MFGAAAAGSSVRDLGLLNPASWADHLDIDADARASNGAPAAGDSDLGGLR